MAFTLNLTPEQEAKLRSVAGQLKVSPEALVQTAVRDLLGTGRRQIPECGAGRGLEPTAGRDRQHELLLVRSAALSGRVARPLLRADRRLFA